MRFRDLVLVLFGRQQGLDSNRLPREYEVLPQSISMLADYREEPVRARHEDWGTADFSRELHHKLDEFVRLTIRIRTFMRPSVDCLEPGHAGIVVDTRSGQAAPDQVPHKNDSGLIGAGNNNLGPAAPGSGRVLIHTIDYPITRAKFQRRERLSEKL